MSIHVTFYSNSSDTKVLNKNITPISLSDGVIVADLTPTQSVSVLSPTLILDYREQLLTANYCKIDEFDRYYYCKVAVDTGGRLIVDCEVDPLMSFNSSLVNCEINVIRSEKGISYVRDSKLPLSPEQCVLQGMLFPINPFDDTFYYDNNILLTVNGG